MAQKTQDDLRRQLLELLLDKVEKDTYPSSTMLDMIERLITPEETREYAELLMSKLEDEKYPSFEIVRRVFELG